MIEPAALPRLTGRPERAAVLSSGTSLRIDWDLDLRQGATAPANGSALQPKADSPGVSRRQRIVYQITATGQEYFAREMTDVSPSAWEDEDEVRAHASRGLHDLAGHRGGRPGHPAAVRRKADAGRRGLL